MTHYPVTTGLWRGVWSFKWVRSAILRACDWQKAPRGTTSFTAPACPDCQAYKAALVRMGFLPSSQRSDCQ